MRATLVWEIGGGRGHIVHLAEIAAALRRRGYSCNAHLVSLDYAEALTPFCDAIFPCPPYQRQDPSPSVRSSTRYGDWLGAHRFDDPRIVSGAIARWRAVYDAERPDIVIAEQSPAAILAARTLALPTVHVGVPVTAPPAGMSLYPPFLPESGPLRFEEGMLRDAVNEALAGFRAAPLSFLPEIYAASDEIVASIDLLDRYDRWRRHRRVPPVIGGSLEPAARRGEEVFVYLSTTDRHEPAILTAIATLNLPTRVVIAGNPLPGVTVAGWRKAKVENRPLPPAEIAALARVLVHAGNHGMSCLGIRAGLPQVALAHQYEHVFDGSQIAAAGAGIVLERPRWTVPAIHRAIREAWESAGMAQAARELAARTAPQFRGEAGESTADRIEAILR